MSESMLSGPTELERRKLLDASLEQALALDAAERERYLAGLRESDPAAAASLERLLGAALRADSLLDGTRWGRLETANCVQHHCGDLIGPYRLSALIGSGGMGEVWSALPLASPNGAGPTAQPVALKLIRSTLSHAVLGERLRRERDILMRLSHPGIARILDSGVSAAGEPYLVLEYVEGQPLLAFAESQQLGLRARMMLFAQICEAVAAAQSRLIVHRDIKPQNILVTASGQAKLLDFGIAKLLDDGGLGASTELTAQLGRAMTPAYAAPEQLLAEPVTTATDVYSLGVLLHELLLGQRPMRPSAENSIALPSKLALRGFHAPGFVIAPHMFARALRGDLDCLLQRAIAHAPSARYRNAEALCADVQAYLAERPLQARADTAAYRLAKLMARHPLASSIVGIAVLSVLLASSVAWQQSHLAQREAARAAYVQQFIEALFSNDLPGAPRDQLPSTAELLRRGAAQALTDREAEPGARLALLLSLAHIQQAQRELIGATQSLQAAQALVAQVADAPEWRGASIAADLASLRAQLAPGERRESVEAMRAAIELARAQGAPSEWLVAALNDLVSAQVDLDQGDAARQNSDAAMHRLQALANPPANLQLNTLTQAVVAYTHDQQFRPAAEAFARAALKLAEQSFGDAHAETAYASMRLALTLRIKGELAAAQGFASRAVATARKAYPAQHPQLARILEESARIEMRLNHSVEGIALWREVLSIRKSQITANSSATENYAVLRTETFLASALLRAGQFEEAAKLAVAAERRLRDSVGTAHPLWSDACSYAASALIELQQTDQALALLPNVDASVPAAIERNSRWRFLELQLIASTLQPQAMRAQALARVIQRLDAESAAAKDVALLLLQAAARAISNDFKGPAQHALAASKRRLEVQDLTHLMEIHQLLSLLLEPESPDLNAVKSLRDQVQTRRGERNFAVRVADEWLERRGR